MAEKTKGGAYTIEISLHPSAATKMTNSDKMLILMSHIVKCVLTVIKVSIKLYKYPVVIRTIQRDCSLVACPCDCVLPSVAMNSSMTDFYPNVTT